MRWSYRTNSRVPDTGRQSGQFVEPPGWVQRNWFAIGVAVLSTITLVLALWRPWVTDPPCGRGLSMNDGVCVGLNLDLTTFSANDPLADLERRLIRQNAAITGPFVTVVVLDNMTHNPETDSDDLRSLRFRVQGAMTAARRANSSAVAGGTSWKIKLLLANYGSGADGWREAVEAVKRSVRAEHIVAVTGIGQSLDNTRKAIADLSQEGIATVGSVVTSDDMNDDPAGRHIQNFVRVAPTNTDEAKAALSHIAAKGYQKVMLIQDRNAEDTYAQTLGSAFNKAYVEKYGAPVDYTEHYRSPKGKLEGADRDTYVTGQFTGMHSDICAIKPDLIYFAGRSFDLRSFMRAQAEGGACGIRSHDVMTGDDASNIVNDQLPASTHLRFKVYYTALAHADQWNEALPGSDNARNYAEFVQAFTEAGFSRDDLVDGHAMMSHDATLTAVTAARQDPLAITDPSTVGDFFLRFRCTNTIPGASGVIALDQRGNPVNKAIPILQIHADGSLAQQAIAWPAGQPLNPQDTCR